MTMGATRLLTRQDRRLKPELQHPRVSASSAVLFFFTLVLPPRVKIIIAADEAEQMRLHRLHLPGRVPGGQVDPASLLCFDVAVHVRNVGHPRMPEMRRGEGVAG